MQRAIRLAMLGRGKVEPNPMVGCVIEKDGRVIGEGYHQQFGGPHAEPNALANCQQSPAGATAYVTLEPCCHHNKKTPPCVPALIEAKVARVVVGCTDPNPSVCGEGMRQLRQAGIEVHSGVMEASAKQVLAPFLAQVVHHRPYVTLKWAQSADGKVAGPRGKRAWISNEHSRRVVHELRARSDAILVGINTVLMDDPLLTVRDVPTMRKLLRAVVDRGLRLPPESQLARTADQGPVVVYCSSEAYRSKAETVATLQARGVEVKAAESLAQVLGDLGERPVTHLVVEPGPTLAGSFLQEGLADRVWVFRSPNRIDDETAPAAQSVAYPAVGEVELEGDRLTEYLNPDGAVYFAAEASADLLITRDRSTSG